MSRLRLRLVVVLVGLLAVGHARGEQLFFYDFNDASNPAVAVDISGNGNDGDVVGPAVFTPDSGGRSGKPGDRAMDFGGFNNGAYVDVVSATEGALDSITDNDQFTLSLWVLGNPDQPQAQWAFYAGPGRQIGSHIPWSDGTIYFDVTGCCGADTRISKNEPDPSLYRGQWNHYAFVKDETYTAIYQNGALWHDSGQDLKNPMDYILEFYVGDNPFEDPRSYSGLMDDVGLWDTALSDEEIVELAAGRPPQAVAGVGVIGDQSLPTTIENPVYGAASDPCRGCFRSGTTSPIPAPRMELTQSSSASSRSFLPFRAGHAPHGGQAATQPLAGAGERIPARLNLRLPAQRRLRTTSSWTGALLITGCGTYRYSRGVDDGHLSGDRIRTAADGRR